MTMISLYDFFPWAWIIHLVRTLVIFNIIHTVLKDRFSTAKTFAVMIPSLLLYSYVTVSIANGIPGFNEKIEILFLIGCIALAVFICMFMCHGKLILKMFAVLLGFFTYFSGTVIYEIMAKMLHLDEYSGFKYEVYLIEHVAMQLTCYVFSFAVVVFIKWIKSRMDNQLGIKTNHIYFLLFPLTHIFCVLIFFTIIPPLARTENISYNSSTEIAIIVLYALCFISDFIIFFAVDHTEKIEAQNSNYEKIVVQNQIDYEQMMILKQEKSEFRKIKHDLLNVLLTIKGLAKISDFQKAILMLEDVTNDATELYGLRLSSNDTINTILQIKKKQAEDKDCSLNVNIDEHYMVQINDYDLCRILSNIIDNSINAASKTTDSKMIDLVISIDRDYINIKCKNHLASDKRKVKSNDDIHGNGIKIIKKIIKKYDGNYTAFISNDEYFCNVTFDNLKNIEE